MKVEPGDIPGNLDRARFWIEKAAAEGAEIVLLPEALPCGWMDPSATHAEPIPGGRHFGFFSDLAVRHRMHLCAGLVERSRDRTFNAAVLISPRGELLLHHRKIYELGIAHDRYALGDRLAVAETDLGRIGLMICADGFAPGQAITRTLCLMGAQLILSPSAWAVPPGHDNKASPYGKLWIDNYGAVTREFGCWIAGCSNIGSITTGPWRGHRCIGSSLVVGPGAAVAATGSFEREELIHVHLDLAPISRAEAS